MNKLVDAISRVEALPIEYAERGCKKKISESCVSHPQYLPMSCIPPAPLPMPLEMLILLPLSLSYGQENLNSLIPVLQDASSWANIISPSVGEYTV